MNMYMGEDRNQMECCEHHEMSREHLEMKRKMLREKLVMIDEKLQNFGEEQEEER